MRPSALHRPVERRHVLKGISLIDIQSFVPTRHKRPGLGSFDSSSAALTVAVSNAGIGFGTCMAEWGAHAEMANSNGTASVRAFIETPCGQVFPVTSLIPNWETRERELSSTSRATAVAKQQMVKVHMRSSGSASTAVSLRRRTDKASNISKLVSANNTRSPESYSTWPAAR